MVTVVPEEIRRRVPAALGGASPAGVATAVGAVPFRRPRVDGKSSDEAPCSSRSATGPAGHRIRLLTTDPMESTVDTARRRPHLTKGPAPEPPGSLWRSSSSHPPGTGGAP